MCFVIVFYGKVVFAGSGKKVANDYDVYAKALCGAQQYDEAINTVNKALEVDKNNRKKMAENPENENNYSASNIQVLEGLEAGRLRTASKPSKTWMLLAE